jgi:hypothetical protein
MLFSMVFQWHVSPRVVLQSQLRLELLNNLVKRGMGRQCMVLIIFKQQILSIVHQIMFCMHFQIQFRPMELSGKSVVFK